MQNVGDRAKHLLERSPVRVVLGAGCARKLGALARAEGATRVLLVTDRGLVEAGHAGRAVESLREEHLGVVEFDGAEENPTTRHVTAGIAVARDADIDFIVGLGGGSPMDCAKGINLILSNGGRMNDYLGDASPATLAARRPLLPMVLVPTTAGTGSEAQSFALISDEDTHRKMACGDRRPPAQGGLRPRIAILDSDLASTAPPLVAATAAIDAASHAIETAATTRRTSSSRAFSRLAWQLIDESIERACENPEDASARESMLMAAHLAGCAIEQSMLGAAHACANPLTARFGITHGLAVGVMLPHIVRFNTTTANPYEDIGAPGTIVQKLRQWMIRLGLATSLSQLGVPASSLPALAEEAAQQWTARFNPRPVLVGDLLEIFRAAMNGPG